MFANVLVTVGTTEFDELIDVVSSKAFCQSLVSKGCQLLTLQIGRGRRTPEEVQQAVDASGLSCTCFRYCATLEPLMKDATLIISHAGAGSIIESLNTPSKPYLVVVNDSLMGNHQLELARAMSSRGWRD
ncbi:unnamed protein product [Ectocarpus fasciculatus]